MGCSCKKRKVEVAKPQVIPTPPQTITISGEVVVSNNEK